MLQNLESQERKTPPLSAKSLYDGVQPVNLPQRRTNPLALFAMLCVLVAGAGAAVYFLTQRQASTPPPVVADAPRPDVAPLVEQAPVATPETRASSANTKSEPIRLAPTSAKVGAPPAPKPRVAEVPVAERPVPTPVARAPKTETSKPVATTTPTKVIAGDAPSATDAAGVVEKRDRVLTPEEKADEYYREAGTLIEKGKTDDARATLAAALATFPGHNKARELAAALALQSGRTHEAQVLLQDGVRLSPQYVSFSLLLARLQVDQGNDALAIVTLENAHDAASGNPSYLSFLATLYQRAARYPEAVRSYRESLALRPQDGRAWLGLGIALENNQEPGAASDAYARALQSGSLDAQLDRYARDRLAVLKK
jgi:MSHA biogenesis protein MshN